ncbi:HAAS signaling domain-containing protein [Demequina globuliformis]|uniref:HAAS signaling domain-containing protein n=1 Tax=Demequina globuliformis TaxID=676202 RepID=UPI0007831789|nr:hypothetical protein [Demequina globuliformis]
MTLTERYIAAVTTKVPAGQREEVASDLREAITDAIDARLDAQPTTPASAIEREVLNDMGDPEHLAATYAERPLFLIGPALFLQWKRLTVLLLWIVLPIIAVLIPIAGYLDGDSWGAVVGQTIGGTITVGVHLVFWVTLVFAVLERSGVTARDVSEPWSVDSLKETPDATVPVGDTIGAAATLVVTAVFLIWQQVYPWASNSAGEGLPLLNPELWTLLLPALLAVMAVELVVLIARQVRGSWTRADAWVTVALNVASVTLLAIPVWQHQLLNRELFTEIGWPDAATTVTLDQVEWLTLVVVAVIAAVDIVSAVRRARRVTPSRG